MAEPKSAGLWANSISGGASRYTQEVSTMEIHPMEERSHSTPVSAPISRTSPTDSREILQQLVQALTLLGHAPLASTPPAPPPTPATRIRSLDAFDGSNLDDL